MADLTCAICGASFVAKRTARYCSEQCKSRAKRQSAGFKERKARHQANWIAALRRDCAWCGHEFSPRHTSTKLCSVQCVSAARWRDKSSPVTWSSDLPPYQPCRWCGVVSYAAGRGRTGCCSSRCSDALRRYRRLGPSMTGVVHYTCTNCGRGWLRGDHHTPSPQCRTCRKREEKRRRRAATRGAETFETFTLREIAERDGWTCHLCGKRVPDVEYSYQPTDATLDHLVPVSAGGPHTRANVRLAHMLCNSKRGTQGVVQLALIG